MISEKNNLCVKWGERGARSSERTHPRRPEQPPLREQHAQHAAGTSPRAEHTHLAALRCSNPRPCGLEGLRPAARLQPRTALLCPGRSLRDVATERHKSAAKQILLLRGHRAVFYFILFFIGDSGKDRNRLTPCALTHGVLHPVPGPAAHTAPRCPSSITSELGGVWGRKGRFCRPQTVCTLFPSARRESPFFP